jgi:prepilin-type N-terminal cleavage/methylation domain-containing protein
MEPMDALKKPGIMAKLRNSKGFSLIEMAIVLVIIGIIVAAIIKGQDLMFNSRAKQLVSTANSWKIAAFAYMDRNGNFPGDSAKNGVVGDTEVAATVTAVAEIASTLSNAPANPVLIGGQSYWFYFGNVDATVGTRNVIVICPSVDCVTTLAPDDVEMFKALDTAIDGSADGGVGQLRSITGVTVAALAAASGARANAVAVSPVIANVTANGSTLPWTAGTDVGAIWTFDKQY